MSRKSRTMLTLKVKLPLPPGYTQPQLISQLKEVLKKEGSPLHSFEMTISVASREVTYL